MVTLFLGQLLISYACLISGVFFYSLIQKQKNYCDKNLFVFLITGLIGMTLLGQLLVLFYPVTIFFTLFIFFSIQGYIFFKWKFFKKTFINIYKSLQSLSIYTVSAIITIWFILIFLEAGPTLMDDTESYHIQMIKWIQEYGSVPGIANLHERFGFNSSWFTSIALFAYSSTNNYYTILNGVLSFWLAFYLLTHIDRIFKKDESISKFESFACTLVLFICALSWPVLRGNVSMANYDAITMVVIFVLFFETIKIKSSQMFNLQVEWMVWPCYLLTVRIINYPLLLLSFVIFILILKQKKWKPLFTYIVFCAFIIIPFFIRNIIVSGYLFFPSPFLDIFSFDWKVDKKVIDDLLYYIKHYNRVNPMFQPLTKTAELKYFNWIPYWFKYLFFYDKILVIPGIIGYLFFIIKEHKSFLKFPFRSIITIVLLIQVVSWFIVAPDPRFIYGCFLCGIVLLIIPLSKFINEKISTANSKSMVLVICLFMLYIGIKNSIWYEGYNHLIVPKSLPDPPLTKIQVNSIAVNIPSPILNNWNARCFAAPLPCAYKLDSNLIARGNKISDGFSIKKK